MLPVLGREVIERKEFFLVLSQAIPSFWIFRSIHLSETIKGLESILAIRRCRTFWKKAFENSALLG